MAAPVYVHATGNDKEQTIDQAREQIEQGFRFVRLQTAVPGQSTYGTQSDLRAPQLVDSPVTPQNIFEPADYVRSAIGLFEFAQQELGSQVELLHDIHERVPPPVAIQLSKDLEPFRLFFLEDPFPPEEIGHFRWLRQHSSPPIAMGELFSNVNEYLPLIREQLIDYIPGDTSPIGHAANLALDLTSPNFGIQEFSPYNQATLDVFPSCHELRDGSLWPNERPGWGIDIVESRAAEHPFRPHPYNGAWPAVRPRDESVVNP